MIIMTTKEASVYLRLSNGQTTKLFREKIIPAFITGKRGGYKTTKEYLDLYMKNKQEEGKCK